MIPQRGKWDTISNYTKATGINWVCPAPVGLCGHPIGVTSTYTSADTLNKEYSMLFQPSCFWDRSHFTWPTEVKWSLICLSSARIFTREAHTWWTNRSYVALVYNRLYTNYKRSQWGQFFPILISLVIYSYRGRKSLPCLQSPGAFCCTWLPVWHVQHPHIMDMLLAYFL